MRGQDRLLAMRKGRVIPNLVFVETDDLDIRFDRHFPPDPEHTLLLVEPTDSPHRLDLRCLVGLVCVVGGCNAQRVEDVTAACKRAGAARVIANFHIPTKTGEFNTDLVTDTEGALAWPTC